GGLLALAMKVQRHRQRAVPLHFHRKGEEATVLPTGPLFANNGDVAVPLVVAGVGIAALPDFITAEALASGAVVPILTDWSLPQSHLHLLSPPSRLRPARVRALSDHLVDTLKLSCTGAHDQYIAPHHAGKTG
ncbi:MAG: hypothetical protein H2055_07790, partial [Sphingopyxis sp.]|nr:hypothetical protein [Sphingopyxis sp.]